MKILLVNKIFNLSNENIFCASKYDIYQMEIFLSNFATFQQPYGGGGGGIPRFPSDKNISGLLLYSWLINVVSMKLERSIAK